MYIRETLTVNPKTGTTYKVHRLVESIRTEKGPRQRVVLNLGTLGLSKVEIKILSKILESRLLGQKTLFENDNQKLVVMAEEALANLKFRQAAAEEEETKPSLELETIDLNSLGLVKTRSAGPEILGHGLWKKLGFNKILCEAGLSAHEIALAEAVVLARLIHPASERETLNWLNNHSSLPELLFPNGPPIGKNIVYEIADTLLANKDIIERGLRENETALFPASVTLYLYDLTNTYFEGQALGNRLARRGKSKEKRSDCPLVSLALLVDSQGFPIFSQIFRGNQSEPETLQGVLSRLEIEMKGVFPEFRPTIAMDKGIATAKNLELLREKNFPYVVVERRNAEKDYAEDFGSMAGFESFEVRSGTIRLKKVERPDSVRVLVVSEGRVAKERAMDELKEKRLKEDVEKLSKSVEKGNVFLPEKVGRRIGRILQRYPSMSPYYAIETVLDQSSQKVNAILLVRKEKSQSLETVRGCYVIETTHKDLEARAIWDLYTTLHRVEHAFRCLKTDLGFRPVHHQKASRTEGHLFISVLAYHLLNSAENMLHGVGDHRSWATICSSMHTVKRGTITFADARGTAHQIRVTETMEPDPKKILENLKIESPFKKRHGKVHVRL